MTDKSESDEICQIHGAATESQNIGQQENYKQLQCLACIKQKEDDMEKLEEAKRQYQEFQNDIRNKKYILNSLSLQIEKIQIIISENLEKLADSIKIQIQQIKEKEEKLKKIFNQCNNHFSVQMEIENFKQNLQFIPHNLKKQLYSLNFQERIDNVISNFEIEWEPTFKPSKEWNQYFCPILQKEFLVKEYLRYFSFNHDGTILVLGNLDKIKIQHLYLPQFQVAEEQIINEICLTCVNFFPIQENIFVSGYADGKIKIWKISEYNKNFYIHQELNADIHIECLQCTQNQLIIVGNKNLKFFNFQNSALTSCQQSIRLEFGIVDISANWEADKLICSIFTDDSNKTTEIVVFKFNGQEWNQIQKMRVMGYVHQVKLLDEYFVLLLTESNKLVAYKLIDKNYEYDQEVNLRKQGEKDYLKFPICRVKGGFVCRHFRFLIFFSFTKRNKLQHDYFPLKSYYTHGCSSLNKQYLIIHENPSFETKIFQFEELKDDL